MNEENEPLGPAGISYRASLVAEGNATPDVARELISEFVRQARAGKVDPRLIGHVADCFAAFLAGERKLLPAPESSAPPVVPRPAAKPVQITNLDKAFGLTRKGAGRPTLDSNTKCEVAGEVLSRLLLGETFDAAKEYVAEARRAAGLPIAWESDVSDAWAKHKLEGYFNLRLSKVHGVDPAARPWTPEEIARLEEIFDGVPGFVPPGVDGMAFMRAALARLDGQAELPAEEYSENKSV